MIKNNNIVYAGLFKRVVSFFVDYTLITFIRSFILKVCFSFFLLAHINSFFEGVSMTLNPKTTEISALQSVYFDLFFSNILFLEILFVLLIIFIVGPLYYVLMTCASPMKTTLGRRIFNIYPINNNGEAPSCIRIFMHYMFSLIPVLLAIYIFITELLVYQNIITPQYSKTVLAILIIIIISWYDLILITKRKLVMHDYITGLSFYIKGKSYSGKRPVLSFLSINILQKQMEKIRTDIEKFISKIKNVKRDTKKKIEEIKAKKQAVIKKIRPGMEEKKTGVIKKSPTKKGVKKAKK